MKTTIFTSNQPRHLALIKKIASVSSEVFAILESNTVFPGLVSDFYKKTDVMQKYFQNVIRAEEHLYGSVNFLPNNVKTLSIKSGDLNRLSQVSLEQSLNSDLYIVFGASYIKDWLIEFLIERIAINIHMGISPYYRGSSCNFWALYDDKPEYVGATIHMLSKGLDSGDILYHALPSLKDEDPFLFTMKAVESAQVSLVERIDSMELFNITPLRQDNLYEVRYTRSSDFTDEVVSDFLSRNLDGVRLKKLMSNSGRISLLNPFYY